MKNNSVWSWFYITFVGFIKNNFFIPKWKHPNPEIRKKAIMKLKDSNLLIQMAKNDENSKVRREAVKRLEDQLIIAYVAQNDKSPIVRRAAVEMLQDQAVLSEIVKNDEDSGVRIEAVDKIEDKSVLIYVARNDTDNLLRRIAAERTGYDTLIEEVMNLNDEKEDNDPVEEYDEEYDKNAFNNFTGILQKSLNSSILSDKKSFSEHLSERGLMPIPYRGNGKYSELMKHIDNYIDSNNYECRLKIIGIIMEDVGKIKNSKELETKYNQANIYLQRDNFKEAELLIMQVIDEIQYNSSVWDLLGLIYMNRWIEHIIYIQNYGQNYAESQRISFSIKTDNRDLLRAKLFYEIAIWLGSNAAHENISKCKGIFLNYHLGKSGKRI